MSLSDKDILHVAKLGALEISPDQIETVRGQINDILEYVAKLSQVSTKGVVPTSHVHGVVNFFRDDIIKDSLTIEQIEQNAPDFVEGFFRVPKII